MTVRHIDVKCAYLHGKLKEEIFMQQPKGFVVRGSEKLVCKLHRSLYGLKPAAKVWHDTIDKVLVEMGFVQAQADPCLYTKTSLGGDQIFLLIYVDDMVLASSNEAEINKIEQELQKRIKLSSLGAVNQFLGIRVTKDESGYFALDQETFIRKIASRFGLANAKGSKVPLNPGYYKNRVGSKKLPNNQDYHGSGLYVAVNTRPDVAASVSILSRSVSDPTEVDWAELKRVVRYLLKTSDYKLRLKSDRKLPLRLSGYSDADWSGDITDRKSNTGYLFKLGEATIAWASRKQTSVSLSSMEAEYTALSEACKELIWIRRLLEDMSCKQEGPTVMFEDNMSCINFVEVERQSRRSKHIDTRMHFTRELVENGIAVLQHCVSENMTADLLTKPVGSIKQKKFSSAMGLVGKDGEKADSQ
ncbi:hypothetical protein RP20_CCG013186 [Aedes albopictus]|nr:hypothetical protein RP20_CCG013186 [Aedes albopictus]